MGKIAFVFSGQGAQYTGMGKELYDSSCAARTVFDMADKIRPGTSEQCFSSSSEELAMTINTQPCLFAVDLACAEALRERGITPSGAAGFSLGEVAAAAFCGILSHQDAFRLVCRRGELMEECNRENPGAMSAVLKLGEDKVESIAAEFDKVYPANYNCAGQIVVAGEASQLNLFDAKVKEAGGRAMRLNVGGGFHTPFMSRAASELYKFAEQFSFSAPLVPLYSNVTAEPYEGEARLLLSKQITNPVRWQKIIESMIASGYDKFIEVGAGSTLTGLMRRINKNVLAASVENARTLEQALELIGARA